LAKGTGHQKKKKYISSDDDTSDSSDVLTDSEESNSGSGSDSCSGSDGSESGSFSESDSGESRVYRSRRQRKEDEANEKVELLTRISGLSKNGFQASKKLTLKDDLDEIRYECYKLQRESNLKKSTKLMQKVLVSITAFVEMAN
ncbi:unnamed protein product, partial [Phaeothamnion confervicola]